MFEYKDAYALLMNPENKVRETIKSPRGFDLILDNYAERRDIPLTNNLSMLGVEPPPRAYGLYRDGAASPPSLRPKPKTDYGYVKGALSTLPYLMRPVDNVLLKSARRRVPPRRSAALHVKKRRRARKPTEQSGRGSPKTMRNWSRTPAKFFWQDKADVDIIDTGDDFMQGPNGGTFWLTVEGIRLPARPLEPGRMLLLCSLPRRDQRVPRYAVSSRPFRIGGAARADVEKPFDHLSSTGPNGWRASSFAGPVLAKRYCAAQEFARNGL